VPREVVDDLERRMSASLEPKKRSPNNLSARQKVQIVVLN
jgi:hypothetical protein